LQGVEYAPPTEYCSGAKASLACAANNRPPVASKTSTGVYKKQKISLSRRENFSFISTGRLLQKSYLRQPTDV
jgi:hypothetical protein